jgi:predicted transcriptional regulator
MFGWLFKKSDKKLEEETKKGFSVVKQDMDKVGKWIRHLDDKDKQLFEILNELKQELSTIKADVGELRETVFVGQEEEINKQVFKRLPVLHKQLAVDAVQEVVQTPVQTGNIYDVLKNLSGNERLIVFALMNTENEMKLSYEDLAMMLGKEKSTIRGQVNAIKQKSGGLIEENSEKNGKKRVYIKQEIKEKLLKYAKVRVKGGKK